MSKGIENYKKLSKPPQWSLKTIGAGRLKGKSDINPQWRYEALTEVYGTCGIGWKFTIDRLWTEQATEGQIFAFANISLYVKEDDKWSDPIPANGGNMLIVKESRGLYNNDEAFKMAVTDALGNACKMVGVASEIYRGTFGTKYELTESLKIDNNQLNKKPLMDENKKAAAKKMQEEDAEKSKLRNEIIVLAKTEMTDQKKKVIDSIKEGKNNKDLTIQQLKDIKIVLQTQTLKDKMED